VQPGCQPVRVPGGQPALVERPAGQPAISDQPEGEGGRRARLPEAPHNSVAHPNTRLLASRIENAELVTFPGLGHLFFWEDPGAFAAAVTTFLRRQDGSR
jgi:pimeloyl-ACP methyl ester carboxylesterase